MSRLYTNIDKDVDMQAIANLMFYLKRWKDIHLWDNPNQDVDTDIAPATDEVIYNLSQVHYGHRETLMIYNLPRVTSKHLYLASASNLIFSVLGTA